MQHNNNSDEGGGRDLLDNRRAGLKSGTFCNHIYQQYLERENTREK